MKKLIALLMVTILALTMTVGGCGAKQEEKTSTEAANESTNSETTVETEEAKDDNVVQAEPEKVELKVFMSFPRFKDQFEAYFEQFKAKQLEENNIDVTIELEMPSADQAGQILQARLASNDAPDIFTLHAIADIPSYYEAGYLADLSDLDYVDTVFESVRNTVTYNEEVVALPLESLAWGGYMYNREIFAKYDLTAPQTIAEMEHVVTTLNDNGETPFLLAFQESWIPQLMMALSLGGTVTSERPGFVDDMNSGTGSYNDVASVFNIIDIIMANGTEKAFEVGSAAGSADFANGKAAMWVQGPWMSGSILEVNPEMEIGVAPLPTSADSAGAMINLSTSTSLAISPTTKHREVANDLLNYILDEQDSSALFESLNFNPIATMHTYESAPWVDEAMSYVADGKAIWIYHYQVVSQMKLLSCYKLTMQMQQQKKKLLKR